jgi:hypothetical protein
MRRLHVARGILSLGLSTLAVMLVSVPPALGASPRLQQRLLAKSSAHRLGFPEIARPVQTGTNTGIKGCPLGAEVVYQNAKNATGLIDEIFSCRTGSATASMLRKLQSSYPKSASFLPPRSLGSSAVGSDANPAIYVYLWTRKDFVAFVAVDTDATTNRAQSNGYSHRPIWTSLRQTLDRAAEQQDRSLR